MVKQIASAAELRETITGAGGKLVVIDFFATWCGPCVAIAPFFQDLGEKYKNAVFVKIDVDNESTEEISQKYEVKCMPTFLFIKDDKQVDRLEGANKDDLENKVKQHSA